jgi:hypothetical protein
MSNREVLIVAQTQEDMDHVKAAYPEMDFKDITELLDITKYPGLARAGIGAKLTKQMPLETHRRVSAIMPKQEGEADDAWKQRTLVHPVLSIVTCGFEQVVSLTPEDSLVYKEYAEKVKHPDNNGDVKL